MHMVRKGVKSCLGFLLILTLADAAIFANAADSAENKTLATDKKYTWAGYAGTPVPVWFPIPVLRASVSRYVFGDLEIGLQLGGGSGWAAELFAIFGGVIIENLPLSNILLGNVLVNYHIPKSNFYVGLTFGERYMHFYEIVSHKSSADDKSVGTSLGKFAATFLSTQLTPYVGYHINDFISIEAGYEFLAYSKLQFQNQFNSELSNDEVAVAKYAERDGRFIREVNTILDVYRLYIAVKFEKRF